MKKKAPPRRQDTSRLTHDSVPATVGLVKEIRDELRADNRSLEHKIEALDHKVDSVRNELKADFHTLGAQIEQVQAGVHKTQVLMEEQRSENRIVLDGVKTVFERQTRVEADVLNLQNR